MPSPKELHKQPKTTVDNQDTPNENDENIDNYNPLQKLVLATMQEVDSFTDLSKFIKRYAEHSNERTLLLRFINNLIDNDLPFEAVRDAIIIGSTIMLPPTVKKLNVKGVAFLNKYFADVFVTAAGSSPEHSLEDFQARLPQLLNNFTSLYMLYQSVNSSALPTRDKTKYCRAILFLSRETNINLEKVRRAYFRETPPLVLEYSSRHYRDCRSLIEFFGDIFVIYPDPSLKQDSKITDLPEVPTIDVLSELSKTLPSVLTPDMSWYTAKRTIRRAYKANQSALTSIFYIFTRLYYGRVTIRSILNATEKTPITLDNSMYEFNSDQLVILNRLFPQKFVVKNE